jgi:polyvinyl alcohol dehydrogenase (cytochrome)
MRSDLPPASRWLPQRDAAEDAEPGRAEDADARARRDSAELVQHASSGRSADTGGAARRRCHVTGTRSAHRAPLEIIPKSAYCATASSADPLAGPAWNGFGGDVRNTRFAPAAAAGLSPTVVPRLKLKWAFGFPGVSASGSQVTVVGNRAFVGSRNGVVYALDAKSGCIVWAFEADAGVRSTPVVGGTGAARALTSATRTRYCSTSRQESCDGR